MKLGTGIIAALVLALGISTTSALANPQTNKSKTKTELSSTLNRKTLSSKKKPRKHRKHRVMKKKSTSPQTQKRSSKKS